MRDSSDELGRQLSRLLTPSSPFGPASADEFGSRRTARAMYDNSNEIDKFIRRTAPLFLIGRRGSGKTAFLRAAMTGDELLVELNSPELITQVARTLDALRVFDAGQFVERVAPVWDAVFLAAVCAGLWSKHCSLSPRDCSEAFRFGQREGPASQDGPATDVATEYLLGLRRRASSGDIPSVNAAIDQVEANGVPLYAARESLKIAAERSGFCAIVSLDSLDKYQNIFYEGGILVTPEAVALQGLFRAAAQTGRAASSPYRSRVSFPSELWHYYSDLSSNPLKDFDNSIILHWDAKELMSVAARRFLKYLEIFRPDQYRSLSVSKPSGHRGGWGQRLLMTYLPGHLRNGMGTEEPTISYILRHTQLLPRHLIHILNHVFSEKPLEYGAITEFDLRRGVLAAEVEITNAIINAYAIPYPQLARVCMEVIPRLPLTFGEDRLHEVVNTSNKGSPAVVVGAYS